jgi:hypothetical protein
MSQVNFDHRIYGKDLHHQSNLKSMTPEKDAAKIWSEAYHYGVNKYISGSKEHKSQFWTAGAAWYAKNLRDEQLDLISYLHHLSERIKLIELLANMMGEEEISLRDASTLLKNLVVDKPPQSLQNQSND